MKKLTPDGLSFTELENLAGIKRRPAGDPVKHITGSMRASELFKEALILEMDLAEAATQANAKAQELSEKDFPSHKEYAAEVDRLMAYANRIYDQIGPASVARLSRRIRTLCEYIGIENFIEACMRTKMRSLVPELIQMMLAPAGIAAEVRIAEEPDKPNPGFSRFI